MLWSWPFDNTGSSTPCHKLVPSDWTNTPSILHISPFSAQFLCPHQQQSTCLAAGTAHTPSCPSSSPCWSTRHLNTGERRAVFFTPKRFQMKILRCGFYIHLHITHISWNIHKIYVYKCVYVYNVGTIRDRCLKTRFFFQITQDQMLPLSNTSSKISEKQSKLTSLL